MAAQQPARTSPELRARLHSARANVGITPRPGALPDDVAEVVRKTLEETPGDATHWSTRSMARAMGYAPSTIHRIWQAFSLQPHRSENFRLSKDPLFVDKVVDIVGLYLNPPEHALVLCVDEKSQVQALDRTSFCFRCVPGRWRGALTTTSATARPRCLLRSISPPARSSASASANTAARSSAGSSTMSKPTCPTISTSISSWTTTQPTRRRRSATGLPDDGAGMSTSLRHRHPGSTRSSASLPNSPKSRSDGTFTGQPLSANITETSAPLGITVGRWR